MPRFAKPRFMHETPAVLLVALLALLMCGAWAHAGLMNPNKASAGAAADAPASGPVAAGAEALTMPAPQAALFADVPAPRKPDFAPAIKEDSFQPAQAYNYQDILDVLQLNLDEAELAYLAEHRFLLLPLDRTGLVKEEWSVVFDEMLSAMDIIGGDTMAIDTRRPGNARLITPDVMLHAFHKFFENSLEFLESYDLGAKVRRFLATAQALAMENMAKADGPLRERYELVAAQLTVPLALIESAQWNEYVEYEPVPHEPTGVQQPDNLNKALQILEKYGAGISPEILQLADQELRLIYEAKQLGPSPLFSVYDPEQKSDYSQYTPRSHYTKSSALRAYFRAMMYLGRNSYPFDSPQAMGDSLLLAHILSGPGPDNQGALYDLWQDIMDITGFYAGAPDDIGYPEWREFIVKVLGTDKVDPAWAVDQAVLGKLAASIDQLRPPRILSTVIVSGDMANTSKEELLEQTKGFRIFGQRFTFDAWTLNQLTAGEEKVDVLRPSTPSALFVATVMGHAVARGMSADFLRETDQRFQDDNVLQAFLSFMDSLGQSMSEVKDDVWYTCMGGAWLKVLGTLSGPFERGYPAYMQGYAFAVKSIQTFLGSYTELKHDTVLYAKQSFVEMGGPDYEDLPPVPKGFVEPNMEFWYELGRLTDYVMAGFARNDLFVRALDEWGYLGRFKRQVDFYTMLAEKELLNQPITEEEYEELRVMALDYMAQPIIEAAVLEERDKRSALVTDIHTDALKNQILYEGTGKPYVMLALVGNEHTPRLVAGLAFNHYEFTGPLGQNRYTDEEWQEMVYENPKAMPAKNKWYDYLQAR